MLCYRQTQQIKGKYYFIGVYTFGYMFRLTPSSGQDKTNIVSLFTVTVQVNSGTMFAVFVGNITFARMIQKRSGMEMQKIKMVEIR
jgi:hypothetical protein